MIDIVQFPVDMKHPWAEKLGFTEFLFSKDVNLVVGGDEKRNLHALRNRNVDLLVCAEPAHQKDHLHWRSSGLNQVLVKLAKKHDIAIGFALAPVLLCDGVERAVLLGRMMQNVRLCRKYKVRMVVCSFARDAWGLRSAADLQSFGRVLGMTGAEAQQALQFRDREKGVRVVSR